MKLVFIPLVFFGMLATAQAEVDVSIANDHRILLFFDGDAAKKIYEEMPKSSLLTPKENCFSQTQVKVNGGFVCTFTESAASHRCELEVSAKTGTVRERTRTDVCPGEGEP